MRSSPRSPKVNLFAAFLIKTFFVPGAAGGQKSFETVTGVKFDTFGFATGI